MMLHLLIHLHATFLQFSHTYPLKICRVGFKLDQAVVQNLLVSVLPKNDLNKNNRVALHLSPTKKIKTDFLLQYLEVFFFKDRWRCELAALPGEINLYEPVSFFP